MQYPAMFQPMKPQFPEKEKLKCPRCESTNTKFCYYNNYNLSQPRHFCKNCRRYWTKGGTLRNIPVGGGTRKNTKKSKSSNIKRSSSFSTSSVSTTSTAQVSDPQSDPTRNCDPIVDQDRQMLETPGSFSSPITSNGQFASLLEGVNPNMSAFKMLQMSELGDNVNLGTQLNTVSGRNPGFEVQFSNGSQSYLGLQNGDSHCWNGDNGWPDLSIYARGSSHQ